MNNNITEDYCSFEISKLLKEKGFDCQCDMLHIEKEKHPILGSLFKDGNDLEIVTNSQFEEYKVEYGFDGYLKGKEILTIPTHALAIKWIRENFQVDIISMRINPKVWTKQIVDWRTYVEDKVEETEWEAGGAYDSEYLCHEAAFLYTLKNLI